MGAPPPGPGQPYGPPPYQGPVYYPPVNVEGLLKKRMILGMNGIGLLLIFVGFLFALSGLGGAYTFAKFLIGTGGLVGAFGSVAGALGSKRTTDMQNLGLFIWAGLLLAFSAWLLIGFAAITF